MNSLRAATVCYFRMPQFSVEVDNGTNMSSSIISPTCLSLGPRTPPLPKFPSFTKPLRGPKGFFSYLKELTPAAGTHSRGSARAEHTKALGSWGGQTGYGKEYGQTFLRKMKRKSSGRVQGGSSCLRQVGLEAEPLPSCPCDLGQGMDLTEPQLPHS